ncbi:MAG: M20/M25/M40 family metallo-hydrolase [Erysipelotrichaceae bacterium]|jgi:glutamyl aminopeptidase|nr:M20/M25/M40 family metallo-hydrolase [Erysipelotrichaceae bacterium]
MKQLDLKLLKQLTQLDAVSSFENHLAKFLITEYQKYHVTIKKDNLGNLFAYKYSLNPQAKTIMIASHMDEVGFMVVSIDQGGFIHVKDLGSHNLSSLPGTLVRMTLKNQKVLHGTILAPAPHLKSGPANEPKIGDFQFDFGFTSKEDAIKNGVTMGLMLTYDAPFQVLNQHRIISKAIDDRYGVFMGLELLKTVDKQDLPYHLVIVNTVEEEVGARGAITATHFVKPDLAIVLDASPTRDHLLDELEMGHLGKGPLVRFLDPKQILNKRLMDLQIRACTLAKVPFQFYQSMGGTDASEIQKVYQGVPVLVHGLPARSLHSATSVYDINDLEAAKKSLLMLLKIVLEYFEDEEI